MPLKGEAKKAYQREYMRRRRAKPDLQTNVIPKEEARARAEDRNDPAALRREIDALRAVLATYKDGKTPPVTSEERARADLAIIRQLGEQLRDASREIAHQKAIIVRMRELEVRRSDVETVKQRMTQIEAELAAAGAGL